MVTARKPKKQNKQARIAAGTLLNATKHTRTKIGTAIDDAVTSSVGTVSTHQKGSHFRRNAVLASLILIGTRLDASLRNAIVDGRRNAREMAAQRMAAELNELDIDIDASDLETDDYQEDEARATAAAQSLAAAWQSMAIFLTLRALRNDEDVAEKLARTQMAMRGRADRTAITESADAFESERVDGIEGAMENDPEFAAAIEGGNIGKRWDCMLEACPNCIWHDGEVVAIGEDFEDGDEPGRVHIRCQCVSTYVSMDAAGEEAA
jgi:hypothetical protein